MHLLKQSTAASVLVGPVLDSTGAAYTGMAIGDFTLTKNGTSAALASAATATHEANGCYILALTTGNTDTLGRAAIYCNKATYAMPVTRFTVLNAAMFDALVTNGNLISAGTGTAQISLSSGAVTAGTVSDKTGYSLATTPPTAAQIAAVILATPANLLATDTSGRVILQPTQTGVTIPTVTTVTNAVSLPVGTGAGQISLASGAVLLQPTQTGVTIPTVTTVTNQLTAAAIASGVWKDTTAGDFTVAGSIGKDLFVGGIAPGAAGGHFIAGSNAATTVNITGTLSTVTTVTNQLTGAAIATAIWQDATAGDFTVSGSAGEKLAAASSAGDPWLTPIPGAYAAGTAGNILGNKIAATLAAADVTGNLPANLVTIATQTVTCAAGVTVGAYVGNATAALAVDASGRVNVGKIADTTVYPYEGVIQSALGSPTWTVTLPTADSAGNAIADDTRYAYAILSIVGGTGIGQTVRLLGRTGTRTYGVDPTSMPTVLDGTSQYVIAGTWKSQALLNATDVTGNVAANVQDTAATLTYNLTGNISGSVGSVTGAVGSVTAAVTAGTVSDKTGYSLAASQTFSTTGAVGSVTAPVTVGTITDKTGYSLAASQSFNTSGSVGSVTGAVGSVTGNVGGNVVGSVGSVSGRVVLDATGLNYVTSTEPTAADMPFNFRQKMLMVYAKHFGPAKKDAADNTIKQFATADGTTVITTQAWTDDGAGTETIGGAS